MSFDRVEWLDEIHRHYGRELGTPVYAAAEILLGRTEADSIAEAINRRGRRVGDEEMATTTAAEPSCTGWRCAPPGAPYSLPEGGYIRRSAGGF